LSQTFFTTTIFRSKAFYILEFVTKNKKFFEGFLNLNRINKKKEKKMDCNKFKKLNPKFIDNETSFFQSLKIKYHMKKCKNCKIYNEKQILFIKNLKNLPDFTPPENLKNKILKDFEISQKNNQVSLYLKYSGKYIKALALSCAAAGIIIGFSIASKTFELKSYKISTGTYVLAVNSDKGDLF
jgi:hypothetical protein